MKAAVDLHIHTALSPCADNEMTPNNIVNMAWLKGLDIIAITDHNSAMNCAAVSAYAEEKGILIVPGMEVETREEVHLICLFPCLANALKMQERVYSALPKMDNREDIFGQQLILDENDNITGYFRQLLIVATNLSVDDVFENMELLGGAVIPAHVNREAYSILSNLGIMPDYLGIKTLEVSRGIDLGEFLDRNPNLESYNFIKSSDAHNLGDISERECFLELDELSIQCLIEAVRSGNIK